MIRGLRGVASLALAVRFVRFGLVGASGTLINLGVLALGQEWLFRAIADPGMRLNASLALAIGTATLNNFYWNRRWTWGDREAAHAKPLPLQFLQYVSASGVSITLQFVLTRALALWMHYLLANMAAIALAAAVNYLLNDRLTFRFLRRRADG